mgnify:CR=1 FL=1
MRPIARIHSDFATKFGIPRQSGVVGSLQAEIIFEPEFRSRDAVRGLEAFSHIWLIWEFSENVRADWSPTVRPPRLGGNVLDVVMPVVPLLHAFSGRPFDGVPVGKSVENDLCRPVFVHLPGSVYRDAHVGITVVQMGDATIREEGVRCFLGGEGREQPRGSREREKQAIPIPKYCCCSMECK